MERYLPVAKEALGKGAFGEVFLARHRVTGCYVAVKRLRHAGITWRAAMRLPEVRALITLSHPSLVRLKEIVHQDDKLYLLFEHLERSLLDEILVRRNGGGGASTASIMAQVYSGLVYMHGSGVFHRDIKPENVLLSGADVVKIADMGSVKQVAASPPYTEYTATRWYRAPELLLRSSQYSFQVDIWAAMLLFVELSTLAPLFPGESDLDMLHKVSSLLGPPTTWSAGLKLAQGRVTFPAQQPPEHHAKHAAFFAGTSPAALQVVMRSLEWDPLQRPSAEEVLMSPLFE